MALTKLFTMRDFLWVWFFWKTQAVLTFLMIVGTAILFSYITTPKYESTAKILILPRTSEGLIITAGSDEKRIAPVSNEDINNEIALLTSEAVIKDTLRSFENGSMDLRVETRGWHKKIVGFTMKQLNEALIFLGLKERLSSFDSKVRLLENSLNVEPVIFSNIVVARLLAENAKAAPVVLTRLLEVYKKHHDKAFTKTESIAFFQDQTTDYRKKLLDAEKKLKEFKKTWNIVDIEKQNEASLELIADLDQELKLIEISGDESHNKIDILKKALKSNSNKTVIAKEMRTIPVIVELEEGLVPLLIKRSEILKRYTPLSREYRNINSQIEIIRGEIKNEITKAIKTDELELDSLRVKQKALEEKIDNLRKKTSLMSQKKMELKELEREIELYRQNYMLYASKTEDTRIYGERQKRDLANVSIVNGATVPVVPVFPKRLLILLVSIFVGFFAALGMPFLLEALDRRLKTAKDAKDQLDLPVICSFPEMGS
jgi:uncharacterized protein involved in exopolysaccharide biosynthesis